MILYYLGKDGHYSTMKMCNLKEGKAVMIKIYPSLMAANVLNLESQIKQLEQFCDGFHIDIMDNHFVPNITFGADTTNAIGKITNKQLWIHLMIENPQNFLEKLTVPSQSIISFHYEATQKIDDMVAAIKKKNWLASISLNPKTSAESVFPFLSELDQVVIMGVEPGFAGQPFLPPVVSKIEPLIMQRKAHKLSFRIGIDGGVNAENVVMLVEKGVQDIAIGSALFSHQNPKQFIEKIAGSK